MKVEELMKKLEERVKEEKSNPSPTTDTDFPVYYDRLGRKVEVDDVLVYCDSSGFHSYYVSLKEPGTDRLLVCMVSARWYDPGGEVIQVEGVPKLWFSRRTWYLDEVLKNNSFMIASKIIDKNKKIYSYLW